ncbi:hypothetical protein KZZ52_34260 [Dactylosporangium sp. AC04546]|uniref:hypothetical protein n=1 Tax=Dactylosporangium sp. AC04546 TaxID=2862460 RepID=UPI001EDD5758|nr:hypothetical protein [Dactylosporangium sp. AC04546]WVK79037.1 hypothetical protein KZZ52_34260 [Dactylosporangium sp. AC04546]
MSFDLVVLAMNPDATASEARAMAESCEYESRRHPEGDMDPRIAAFYVELTQQLPDRPPYSDDAPWSSMPLTLGIDHVVMYMGTGTVSTPAIDLVRSLAQEHRLVIYDGQGDNVYLPDGSVEPSVHQVQGTVLPLGHGLGGLIGKHEVANAAHDSRRS